MFAYDLTDPGAPSFAAYANARDVDLGPEGLAFVPAEDSPTCAPLVLVGNEVSRTLAVYEVGVARTAPAGVRTGAPGADHGGERCRRDRD